MSDQLVEGTWSLSSSGATAPYFNWANSEPNGGTGENCASMNIASGNWMDTPCSYSYNTLCEKVIQIQAKGNVYKIGPGHYVQF